MSDSEHESSASESPVTKTRRVLRQLSRKSEKQGNGTAVHEDNAEEDDIEKSNNQEGPGKGNYQEKQTGMQAKYVSSKPNGGPVNPPKTAVALQHPKYDEMVEQAVKELVENQRTGTSIQKVMKFIENKYSVPEAKAKLFCKKSIQKGLKNETYVKTSGIGLTGSIDFSASYKKKMKREQMKLMKLQNPKDLKIKTKAVAKKNVPNLKAKPKTKEFFSMFHE
ncbi:uncharacterized protein LOC128740373 [Sabethes cyaneus]|uniref:uncharacterized protein LOC128740373 n=1 Tax=Sabethes cyaneus TaxID=53552 RepID=UPI00237D5D5E|nr:uncharacterized protein LOC128740373 [Sabethes cyaneus]